MILMTAKELKYDESSRRKAVNLTINQDLLVSARKYKLNLSKILEDWGLQTTGTLLTCSASAAL